ncbi:hypothetical protein DMC01_10145 [Campylobacter troglodytis]|nr:hypothetical protein DMC01_10145 [Campylobacter troglodytis]
MCLCEFIYVLAYSAFVSFCKVTTEQHKVKAQAFLPAYCPCLKRTLLATLAYSCECKQKTFINFNLASF